jgi:hypothetical protein
LCPFILPESVGERYIADLTYPLAALRQ